MELTKLENCTQQLRISPVELVLWNIWMIFPFSWEFHHPNWRTDELIFFRGVGSTTKQIMCFKVPQRWDDMFPLDMTGTQTCHSDQSSAVKDTVPFATMYEKVSHAVAWRFPKEPSIQGVANGFWLNLGFWWMWGGDSSWGQTERVFSKCRLWKSMKSTISCSSLLDNWASPGFGGLPFLGQKTKSFTEMHLTRQEGPTKEMCRVGFSTGCAPSDPMKFPDFWISENWLLSHHFVNVSNLMIHDISLSISKMMVFTCFHLTIRDSKRG